MQDPGDSILPPRSPQPTRICQEQHCVISAVIGPRTVPWGHREGGLPEEVSFKPSLKNGWGLAAQEWQWEWSGMSRTLPGIESRMMSCCEGSIECGRVYMFSFLQLPTQCLIHKPKQWFLTLTELGITVCLPIPAPRCWSILIVPHDPNTKPGLDLLT